MIRRLPLPFWILIVGGLLDGLSGLVEHAPSRLLAHEVFALLPVLALWVLFGSIAWAGYALLWALCYSGAQRHAIRSAMRDLAPKLWRERNTRASRELAAAACACLLAGSVFVVGSVMAGATLIENRHGAVFIAIAILGAQTLLALACVIVARAVARALGWAFEVIAEALRLPALVSAPALALALVTGIVAVSVLGMVQHWETLVAIDAGAIALGASSCLGLGVAHVVTARRARARAVALMVLAAVLVLGFGLRDAVARSFANDRTLVAKYMLAELRDVSDFDKDGTPWFPAGEDCAPFDATRHVFALEKPHNGIDENCDGADRITYELAQPNRHEKPVRTITPKPNLVLITMDATRGDHMGFLGYKRHPTTPNLDALANKSTVFTSAFSQDSGTGPSTWSLMTGRTPFQVEFSSAKRFPFAISSTETLLAEALSQAGYQTSAALCGSMFAKRHWNIRRGFRQFTEVCGTRVNKVSDLTATEAIGQLQKLSPDRPFFFWVHLFDPHSPYADHADLSFGNEPIDRYDEEIHATDAAIGRILKAVNALAGERPTYVAVTADHGENFNEHGSARHARNLYREVTHVPLLIAGTDVKARKVTAPVASADLYPTLLELAGLTIPTRCTMTSQFNVLFGAAPDKSRLVFQENSFSRPVRHVKAVVSDRRHLLFDISNHVLELYDWRNDPQERVNLYGGGEAEEHRLRQALLVFLTTTSLPAELKH